MASSPDVLTWPFLRERERERERESMCVCVCERERERDREREGESAEQDLLSLLTRMLNPQDQSPALMVSFNLNFSVEAPSPNTATVVVRASRGTCRGTQDSVLSRLHWDLSPVY
jgi:hypothetical protein